jgi:nucleotide-binding universal stress UspA family protein
MYTKILVPLDGSETAECVFPSLRWLMKVSKVDEVTLIRVVEPFRAGMGVDGSVPPEEREAIDEDAEALARDYLEKVAARFKAPGVTLTPVVLEGKPAEAVGEYAAAHDVDLILMATHGYSGLQRILRGSTADAILHAAHVPVLLVRPEDRKPDLT